MVRLVCACLQNAGTLSANHIQQLTSKGHPTELIGEVQRAVTAALEALDDVD